jgi:hypothetical protein
MRFHRILSAVAALALGAMAGPSLAVPIKVTLTVDNSYALFTGSYSGATNFIGTDGSWPTAETYNFDLSADSYIYVVTASDLSVAQGFLGQFTNMDTGYKFYSNDTAWQVMSTGLGAAAPYSGTAANLSLLSKEIQDANAGGNPSQGWKSLTAGRNNGASPWRMHSARSHAGRLQRR